MGIYDNGDDRPSVLSEFIDILRVLLVFRLGKLCQACSNLNDQPLSLFAWVRKARSQLGEFVSAIRKQEFNKVVDGEKCCF